MNGSWIALSTWQVARGQPRSLPGIAEILTTKCQLLNANCWVINPNKYSHCGKAFEQARDALQELEKLRSGYGRLRPLGEPNSSNDRLPATRRNSFVGPDYTFTDMRISRWIYVRKGWKLDLTAESFNLFNRLNRRFQLTDDGIMSNAARFNYGTKHIGINYFPAHYQVPTNLMKATNAYAPRQLLQLALRMSF